MAPRSFRSTPIGLTQLRDSKPFYRADLLFYEVEHLGPSFRAAIFFNRPRARADTPEAEEQGFAGAFSVFGKGACTGEDGHCIPRGPLHEYDHRPPHPMLPKTKIVTVTDALRRVIADGAEELVVTAVPKLADMVGVPLEGNLDRPLRFQQLSLVTYDL